ncbi:hypothetical protein PROFUN_04629 [Planoprotostelium fungivorum]|uniref:Uncharacterized protein n=1 Tax=Planoprotostelium fungivorum TaxID=1890364 RepID=A0A2P6NUF3_9EUKA|nr:hypothetical protein PROFUN_04629 [Planoprotostelium fungivorum]
MPHPRSIFFSVVSLGFFWWLCSTIFEGRVWYLWGSDQIVFGSFLFIYLSILFVALLAPITERQPENERFRWMVFTSSLCRVQLCDNIMKKTSPYFQKQNKVQTTLLPPPPAISLSCTIIVHSSVLSSSITKNMMQSLKTKVSHTIKADYLLPTSGLAISICDDSKSNWASECKKRVDVMNEAFRFGFVICIVPIEREKDILLVQKGLPPKIKLVVCKDTAAALGWVLHLLKEYDRDREKVKEADVKRMEDNSRSLDMLKDVLGMMPLFEENEIDLLLQKTSLHGLCQLKPEEATKLTNISSEKMKVLMEVFHQPI